MRVILVILGLVLLVLVLLMVFGMINIDQTQSGRLPRVSIEGGQAPKFQADVGKVDVGTTNKVVSVPTVSVQKPANAQ